MTNLDSWVTLNREKIVALRRWLHQNPEIGFDEFNTAKHLSKILSEAGYEIITNDSMKTGFYCDYNHGDKMLALRTDMDALEIQENNPKIDYQSGNPGVMHACGHDVHMTIVAAVALYLKETNYLNGRVRFVFQPAEEQAPGGALSMIEGGALEEVSDIIGCHVFPKINAGKVAVKGGPIAATVELIDIKLKE